MVLNCWCLLVPAVLVRDALFGQESLDPVTQSKTGTDASTETMQFAASAAAAAAAREAITATHFTIPIPPHLEWQHARSLPSFGIPPCDRCDCKRCSSGSVSAHASMGLGSRSHRVFVFHVLVPHFLHTPRSFLPSGFADEQSVERRRSGCGSHRRGGVSLVAAPLVGNRQSAQRSGSRATGFG